MASVGADERAAVRNCKSFLIDESVPGPPATTAPKDTMGKELLFEIGTEEIPSGYLPPALEDLKAVAGRLLAEQRLAYTALRTLGTPRRLTLLVEDLAERQADAGREVIGPPKAVAFDAEGRPTKAAEGFARAQGVGRGRPAGPRAGAGRISGGRAGGTGSRTAEVLIDAPAQAAGRALTSPSSCAGAREPSGSSARSAGCWPL